MPNRISLFQTHVDSVTLQEAVSEILCWTREEESSACRTVFALDLDRAVTLQHHSAFQQACRDADLVVASSEAIISGAKWAGKKLPERIDGNYLIGGILAAADARHRLKLFIVGSDEQQLTRAALNMSKGFPHTDIVGAVCPPAGFDRDAEANAELLSQIAECQPDLLLVALSGIRQELWVRANQDQIRAKVALSKSDAVRFFAGEKLDPPEWMEKCRVGWLHDMTNNPEISPAKYAWNAWNFPRLVWREWWFGSSVS